MLRLFFKIIKVLLLLYIFYFVCELFFFCRSLYVFDSTNFKLFWTLQLLTAFILVYGLEVGLSSIVSKDFDSGELYAYIREQEDKVSNVDQTTLFQFLKSFLILIILRIYLISKKYIEKCVMNIYFFFKKELKKFISKLLIISRNLYFIVKYKLKRQYKLLYYLYVKYLMFNDYCAWFVYYILLEVVFFNIFSLCFILYIH